MKQMTCAQMGGPADCTVTFQGTTPEEIVKSATDHVMATHPDIAAQMKDMSPEDQAKWMADFKPKFDAQPEM